LKSSKIEWIYAGLGLAAGVGLVVALSRSSDSVDTPYIGPSDRLLLIGDSLAEGLAPPLKTLAQASQIPFFADAKRGTRFVAWAEKPWLYDDLSSFQPTVTLVSLGTNVMTGLPNPEEEAAALGAIVRTIVSSGSRVIFIAPPSMPFNQATMDKVRAMIAAQGKLIFPSDSLNIPRGSDGIHSTSSGYAGWAGAVWQWMSPSNNGMGRLPDRRIARRQVRRKVFRVR